MRLTLRPRATGRWLSAAALTVAAYLLADLVGALLTIRPSQASPFYPAAGVALAALLLRGRRMLPAVVIAAVCVHLMRAAQGAPQPDSTLEGVALAVVLGLGAGLQAWVASAGVRRFVSQPVTLSDSRDVARFFLVAAASSVVNAGFANLARWATGLSADGRLTLDVLVWWSGDLFGIVIVVPIALALFGRPRDAWVQRRVTVGLTLCLATLALGAGIRTIEGWRQDRRLSAFERDAASASLLLSTQLRESLEALKAFKSAWDASGDAAIPNIPGAMRDWVGPGHLLAIGWAPWLRREDVPAYEQEARRSGTPGFHVFDKAGTVSDPAVAVVPVRYVEPTQGANAALPGLNVMSAPASRAAIDASRRTAEPVATAGFQILQNDAVQGQEMGVVVFQVLREPRRAGITGDTSTPRGVAFTTLRPDEQVRAVQTAIAPYLQLCIDDLSDSTAPYRLAGGAACDAATGPRHSRSLFYAGRHWELGVVPQNGEAPSARDAEIWLFALVGLCSTAMLGGFLLVMTGRARRIETAVEERTAALRAEVAERELAQTALRESEQRFRNIFNNAPIGICYTDLRGNVKLVNPRYCELVGRGEAELLRLNALDVTHPDDRAEDTRLSRDLIRGAIPMYRHQKRYVRADGVLRVQATVTLLRDGAGVARRLVGVVEDVTEHQRLEDAERAREAAEASNRAKSDFLSRMSHELRTPLNAMLGFAQLLELDPRQPLTATQRPWVTQIQQAGWHLLEMINDVLDLSRIDSGNLRLSPEALSLEPLIDATRALVQADADKRGITITQDREPGALSAIGDATRVKQILTNLLSNAVKYNADGGTVHIGVRQVSAHTVEIDVTDSGLGMTDGQLAQLFEPFNRLGREKSNLEGTGIGLVISRRLAELMGGSLTVASVAGVGSTFTLALPCESEPDTVRSNFDAAPDEPAEYHRRLVHYVEDNETNVEVMRGILAQRPQVELEVSITGLDGLAAIRARQPDLILLDMHLPDISGMELLRHFKGDPALASIPVVVVSADALREQVAAAVEAGCAAYLTKPVNIAELLQQVDMLLEAMDTRYG